jgi:TonB family protein
MRTALTFGLCALMLCTACATKRSVVYGGLARAEPHVTLESATETKDSPAHGYAVSPFPMPAYPFELIRAGIWGEVTVRLLIGKDGAVREATIVKSTQKEFEVPVLFAVKSWRFRETAELPPVEAKGMIVDCSFKFSLE